MPQNGRIKRSAAKAENHRTAVSNAGRSESGAGASGRGVGAGASHEESKQIGDTYGDGADGGKSGDKVTVDMKMDLVAKVKKLSNEGLTKLVKHVQTVA